MQNSNARQRRAEAIHKRDHKREIHKREKRAAKAERRAQRRAERGTVVDSGATAVGVAPDQHPEPTPRVARYGLKELENTKIVDLKKIAKEMGLKGYTSFPKLKLVEFIYRSDENLR